MPQGFTEVPSYFLCILNANLKDLKFPEDSTSIQYVNDFLLCSDSYNNSLLDPEYFLKALVGKGHKVARDKIQLRSLCVRLSHDVSAADKIISTDLRLYY